MAGTRSFPHGAALMALVLLLFLTGCAGENGEEAADNNPTAPPRYAVMTYNVLFDFPNPDYPPWSVRKEGVAENIMRHEPDLIGLQEPFLWQVQDILALTDGYRAIHDGLYTDAAILYKADRFRIINFGSFWLSPTPGEPLSTGFGNFFPRICVWAVMYDLYSDTAFVFSVTHFDNTSPFQETAAPLYVGYMDALGANLPVIAVGDYNSRPGSEAYGILTQSLSDTFYMVESYELIGNEQEMASWNPDDRIDHIFVGYGDFAVHRWLADLTTYGDPPQPPSDHWPVVAEIEILK